MPATPEPMHKPVELAQLAGTLMSVDIDDVRVGDVMFMGGHLVRRVWTNPFERSYSANGHTVRKWQGLKLDQPTDGSVARGEYNTAVGTAVLILRPGTPDPAPLGAWDSDALHPVTDWQHEVSNDDTRASYADWVRAKRNG